MSLTPPRVLKLAREVYSPAALASELSRHLVRAQEEERRRISRELHDSTGQGLMVLRLYLAMVATGKLDSETHLKLQEALRVLDGTIDDLRRIVKRLSPRLLEDLGLLGAIRKDARDLARNCDIEATIDLPKQLGKLSPETELALYRATQESLHNIARHSRATSFSVQLKGDSSTVSLLIKDDGAGFGRPEERGGTFGLRGMRERIAALGGKVKVRSRPGVGTSIHVSLPRAFTPSGPVFPRLIGPMRSRKKQKVSSARKATRGRLTIVAGATKSLRRIHA